MRKIERKINPAFYDRVCIEEAIAVFHEVCDASFDGNMLIIEPKEDVENIEFELLNYVFGIMKNRGLV